MDSRSTSTATELQRENIATACINQEITKLKQRRCTSSSHPVDVSNVKRVSNNNNRLVYICISVNISVNKSPLDLLTMSANPPEDIDPEVLIRLHVSGVLFLQIPFKLPAL